MKLTPTAPGRRAGLHSAVVLMVLAAALVPATGAGAAPPEVTTFTVPSGTPTAITAGPDGAVWFAASDARVLGRITTAGDVTEFPLPPPQSGAEALGGIATGSDGALWLADCDTIRRYEPATGTWAAVPIPVAAPDTTNPCARSITAGPDAGVWYTSTFDDASRESAGGHIGRVALSPDHGITEFAVGDSLVPETITTGPDGNLWFTERGHGLGRLTSDGSMTDYPFPQTPQHNICPRGLTTGPDGALWFHEICNGAIGRFTTAGSLAEFAPSAPIWSEAGIAAGPDGAVWYVFDDGRVGRMTPDGTASEVDVPDSIGGDRATGIVAGPDGAMWFTGLALASAPTSPTSPPPTPNTAPAATTTSGPPPPPTAPHASPGTTTTTGPPPVPTVGFIGRVSVPIADDASETLAPGDTVSTNATSSPDDPVGTSVTSPDGGPVSIQEGTVPDGTTAPVGYGFLDQQVEIHADNGASIDRPLVFEFRLDKSLVDKSLVPADQLDVFRDGVLIEDCTRAEQAADPDPCVDSRTPMDGGDLRIRVRSSRSSTYNFGGDTAPPTIACAAADGRWHATNVAIACTATDAQSGLAAPADAAFWLRTAVPPGTQTAAAATDTRSVCDRAGHCASAGPVTGNKIDRLAPSIDLRVPADGARYALLSRHTVDYACTDAGAPLASCTAPQADGTRLPTGLVAIGTHTFTVTATDRAGNTTRVTHQYRVGLFPFPTD